MIYRLLDLVLFINTYYKLFLLVFCVKFKYVFLMKRTNCTPKANIPYAHGGRDFLPLGDSIAYFPAYCKCKVMPNICPHKATKSGPKSKKDIVRQTHPHTKWQPPTHSRICIANKKESLQKGWGQGWGWGTGSGSGARTLKRCSKLDLGQLREIPEPPCPPPLHQPNADKHFYS